MLRAPALECSTESSTKNDSPNGDYGSRRLNDLRGILAVTDVWLGLPELNLEGIAPALSWC